MQQKTGADKTIALSKTGTKKTQSSMYGLCGKRPSEMQFEALNNDLIAVGM
jgi:hypothetical protein